MGRGDRGSSLIQNGAGRGADTVRPYQAYPLEVAGTVSCADSQVGGDFGSHSSVVTERSYRDSEGHFNPGVLQPSVHGPEGFWWRTPGDRSEHAQHLPGMSEIQDGNFSVHKTSSFTGGVGNVHRYPGRVLAYSPCPVGASVFPLCGGRSCLPVPVPPVWPEFCSPGIHQVVTPPAQEIAEARDQGTCIPGRLDYQGQVSGGMSAAHAGGSQVTRASRLVSEPQEVVSYAQPEFRLPEHVVRHSEGHSGSSSQVSRSNHGDLGAGQASPAVVSTSPSPDCRTFAISGNSGTQRTSQPQTDSVLDTRALGSTFREVVRHPESGQQASLIPGLVGPARDPRRRPTGVPGTVDIDVHRCFEDRLGSSSGGRNGVGCVASGTPGGTHQRVGAPSCTASVAAVSTPTQPSLRPAVLRQFDSSGVHPEGGGHTFGLAHDGDVSADSLVRRPLRGLTPGTPSRSPERPSGRPVSQRDGAARRMGVATAGAPTLILDVGDPAVGSIRHQSECQDPGVCISTPGRRRVENRRLVVPMEQPGSGVRIPARSVTTLSDTEDSGVLGNHIHSDSSRSASTTVVSRATQPGSGGTVRAPVSGVAVATESTGNQELGAPSRPGTITSSRMACIHRILRDRGYDNRTVGLAAQPQRDSSAELYDKQWDLFAAYCAERDWAPEQASSQELTHYLTYLFLDRGLAPATVKVHRAAITSVLSLGEYNPTEDVILSRLIRRFDRDRPRVTRITPKWSLTIVLEQFLRPPFVQGNPTSDRHIPLNLLLYKTTFLLALACGARRSELHALVRNPLPRVLRDPSSGAQTMELRVYPGFVAKNQLPDTVFQPFMVPSLHHLVPGEVERFLCPVRAVSLYLERTTDPDFLKDRRALLLHFNPSVSKTKASHVSQWIVDAIVTAYKNLDNELLQRHQVNAHEVRAIANSLSYFNNCSLTEVLDGARWRSTSTFINHYLRDMVVDLEGIYQLGPVVVAQRVIHQQRC